MISIIGLSVSIAFFLLLIASSKVDWQKLLLVDSKLRKQNLILQAQLEEIVEKQNLTSLILAQRRRELFHKETILQNVKDYELSFVVAPHSMRESSFGSELGLLPDAVYRVTGSIKLVGPEYQKVLDFRLTGDKENLKKSLMKLLIAAAKEKYQFLHQLDLLFTNIKLPNLPLPKIEKMPFDRFIIVPTSMDYNEVPSDIKEIKKICKKNQLRDLR